MENAEYDSTQCLILDQTDISIHDNKLDSGFAALQFSTHLACHLDNLYHCKVLTVGQSGSAGIVRSFKAIALL